MPRPRVSEMPQRPSPRASQPRTSSSESDSLHYRPITERSTKIGDRRSPRGSQSEPVQQKKLGTRIAHLESQLGKAQEELKMLKDQLVSARAGKKEVKEEQEKTNISVIPEQVESEEQHLSTDCQASSGTDRNPPDEVLVENQRETDVFEIQLEKVTIESKVEEIQVIDKTGKETQSIVIPNEPPVIPQPEKPSCQDLAVKDDEINLLKLKLEEKEKELEILGQENIDMKIQINKAITSNTVKQEEMTLRLSQLGEELDATKSDAAQLKEKLEIAEGAKEALEAEMKMLRVRTEQWRKAADAAAAILSGDVGTNGRISDRCGSMDKQLGGMFESSAGGYNAYVGSPVMGDDMDDGFGKRKGSGIRMFGDLWRKKSQK